MSFRVVIPARYASTRLPGKPLLDIAGKTMLQRVYEQAQKSSAQQVLIATDDVRIQSTALAFGAEVCMTSAAHPSGTDRIEEVSRQLQLEDGDILVNVQGDEPLIPPALIDQVAGLLLESDAEMATLSVPIQDAEEALNPNAVKVVASVKGDALYFSRAPIPWARGDFVWGQRPNAALPDGVYQRHIGIYAYRVGLLKRFVQWPPAPLEQIESLEQLRVLYQGARIRIAVAQEEPPAGVDTPEDLERVRLLLTAKGRLD